jgi:hypothetical protein
MVLPIDSDEMRLFNPILDHSFVVIGELDRTREAAERKDMSVVKLGFTSGLLIAHNNEKQIFQLLRMRCDRNYILDLAPEIWYVEQSFKEKVKCVASAFGLPDKVVLLCLDSLHIDGDQHSYEAQRVFEATRNDLFIVNSLFVSRLLEARYEYKVEKMYGYLEDGYVGLAEKEIFEDEDIWHVAS